MILYQNDRQSLSNLENRYSNPNGNQFKNEASKILQRYIAEGKPTAANGFNEEPRKQVRFDDNDGAQVQQEVIQIEEDENRI